jgi:SagB-type dehydrogenase family enzyme
MEGFIMTRLRFKTAILTGFLSMFIATTVHSQEIIKLPEPKTEGGMPLMQALKERRSGREFSSRKLSPETLSSLLWAAWGINRPDGHRTAPSARNLQDIDVYVAMDDGLYRYEAKNHQLQRILSEDIRGATGNQDYVKDAALNLIYVSDLAKLNVPDPMAVEFFTGAHTGFLSQNVYLFCASEGLSTVVRGNIDKPALAKIMKLRADQKITLAQSVGYPPRP